MARVFWLLALFTAFFVVGMRLAGLPLAVASACDAIAESAGACEESAPGPSDQDQDGDLAPVDSDENAEHGSAPLMTLPRPRLQVLALAPSSGARGGALSEQRARPSHVRDLERPPRS